MPHRDSFCPPCLLDFPSSDALYDHFASADESLHPKCPSCAAAFVNVLALWKHQGSVHRRHTHTVASGAIPRAQRADPSRMLMSRAEAVMLPIRVPRDPLIPS
ncbi:uncharacterized protein FIBRA_07297 [Fibroporia radiculosa]|uniref:C2H2-type domain-containing protein n=1 Tax=Fibroporia radiculosa TaxID=599839 RepID=J4GUN6_9APHY|nr:uncharacterized protein FIBRA_07297 [Fibroporia radiculosa]CCM05090.1 predicted protein [Fibroporia radiculosa]